MLKNFKVIEVISRKSKANLTFYQGKLKFNHPTAAELDFAPYVQLAYDSNQQCFAIIAATKDDDNAIQFYNRSGETKPYPITLYAKAAIDTIAQMMDWHDENKYYSIPGQRFVEEKAIVFNLKDATEGVIGTRGVARESDDE